MKLAAKVVALFLVLIAALSFPPPTRATSLVEPVHLLQTAQGADTVPWYSSENWTLAAGVSYQWWKGGDAVLLDPRKEWAVGLYNAWTLTKHIDATGNVEYGTDSKVFGYKLGVRFVLKGAD